MPKQVFNKLVRDGIPAELKRKGIAFGTRTLEGDEFTKALLQKLSEEATELRSAGESVLGNPPSKTTLHQVLVELADLQEVMEAVCERLGVDPKLVAEVRAKKLAERSGAKNGIFLEWTQE